VTVRRGGVVLPSLLAGVLLALSLPPFGWWPLAFAGAGLLYWRLHRLRARTRFLAGWVAGLGLFGVGLYWIESFNWYGAVVLVVAEALSMGLAALLVPPSTGRLPAFVGAFTLCEALRMSWPFGGLPVAGVFLGQAGGPFLGTARLGGSLLLTAVVFLGGAAVGELTPVVQRAVQVRLDPSVGHDHHEQQRAAAGLVTLAFVLGLAVVGVLAPDGGSAGRSLTVAAVQGGGRRGFNKEEVPPATVFAAQLAATRTALFSGGRRSSPELVVWPEDVISLDEALSRSHDGRTMARLARRLRSTVVAGVTITVSATAFRNEVVAWGPTGRVVAVFEKTHRVPFGEYIPDRSFFAHFADLAAVPLDAVPGHGTGLMVTPAAPLGVLVSYDVFFTGLGRTSIRGGAQLLVVPTNTSSYAAANLPTQEVAAAQVQAVAGGRDLVQAAPTGFSAVIDHEGNVLLRSDLGRRQVLFATVGLRRGRTVYDTLGDAGVLVPGALVLALGWLLALRARRRGADADHDPRAGRASLDFTSVAGAGHWPEDRGTPVKPHVAPHPVAPVAGPAPAPTGPERPAEG